MASSSSSVSSSSDDDDDVPETKKRQTGKVSAQIIESSDSSSSSSSEEDEWNSKPAKKSKAKGKGRKKVPPKAIKRKRIEEKEEGEVEDNDDDGNDIDEDDDDCDDYDDDDDERLERLNEQFNDGYDDDLMGDDEDRLRLSMMSEKEREVELFNRGEKREAAKFRFEIQKKLRLQKLGEFNSKKKSSTSTANNESKSTVSVSISTNEKGNDKDKSAEVVAAFADSTSRSVERRRNMEDKRKVKDAIKGLKAEREKKKLKQKLRAADVYSDSSDSDSNSDSDHQSKPSRKAAKTTSSSDDDSSSSISDDDSDTDHPKGKSSESRSKRSDEKDWDNGRSSDGDNEGEQFLFTLEHLNSIRLSRFKMEKWCHAPCFKDTITGCFVRIGVGNSYMVGQITEVVETNKVYLLGKARTNKGIKLKHAKQPERIYRCEYISNSEFTQQEYDKWYSKMVADRCDFPSREFVDRKKTEIQNAINYQFSDADVELMVAEKEKFKEKPVNFAMKKSELMKNKEYAEANGDHDRAIELAREIDRLEDEAKKRDKIRTQNIAAISFINERNRMRNIKEAERAIAEAAKEAQKNKDDPFTRRKCAPTMISNFNKKVDSQPSNNEMVMPPPPSETSMDIDDSPNTVTNGNDTNTNGKVKPIPEPMISSQDSDDLFSAHNFDIKIEFDIPSVSSSSANSSSLTGGFLSNLNNGKSTNGFGDARPTPIANVGANRRSLNLDEYKKKKGLI